MKVFKNLISLISITTFIFGSGSSAKSLYGEGVPVQKPYIPFTEEEFIQNYKKFASDLVHDTDLSEVIDGVIHGPFSLGHALAVLNEQVILNVSTQGFDKVLQTPYLQIRNSYRDLLHILTQDPKLSITSTIYTQHDKALLTIGLGKLKSQVNLVDPKLSPEEYIDFINNDVRNKSGAIIPVPAFPNRSGIPDGDYFATTLNYKADWENKWSSSSGKKSFNSLFTTEPLEFQETIGNFEYTSNDDFEAVKIPLTGGSKTILFAKSKKHVESWESSGKKVWEAIVSKLFDLKVNDWSMKKIKLQIPPFKYLSGISYFNQLEKLGISETMCLKSPSQGQNYLEQIGQINLMEITPNDFSFSSITATKDNFNDKNNKLKSRGKRETEGEEEQMNVRFERKKRQVEGNEELGTITLDQPYFWSLEDDKIGSIALGVVLLPIERKAKLSQNYMEQFILCNKK